MFGMDGQVELYPGIEGITGEAVLGPLVEREYKHAEQDERRSLLVEFALEFGVSFWNSFTECRHVTWTPPGG